MVDGSRQRGGGGERARQVGQFQGGDVAEAGDGECGGEDARIETGLIWHGGLGKVSEGWGRAGRGRAGQGRAGWTTGLGVGEGGGEDARIEAGLI